MAYTQYKYVIAWNTMENGQSHWSTGSQLKDESRKPKASWHKRRRRSRRTRTRTRTREAHQLNAKFFQAVCRTRIIDDDTTLDNEGNPHLHTQTHFPLPSPSCTHAGYDREMQTTPCSTIILRKHLKMMDENYRFLQRMQMRKITFTWLMLHRGQSCSNSITITITTIIIIIVIAVVL